MAETKRLYRSCKNRILGGVAGGLGEYLDVDPTLIRLIFLVLLFSGIGFFVYIVAWIIIPEDPSCRSGKTGADEIREKAETFAQDVRNSVGKKDVKSNKSDEDVRVLLGAVVLALGVLLLVQNLIGPFVWRVFWPAIFIVFGLFIILKTTK